MQKKNLRRRLIMNYRKEINETHERIRSDLKIIEQLIVQMNDDLEEAREERISLENRMDEHDKS